MSMPRQARLYARWIFLAANFLELRKGEVQHKPRPTGHRISGEVVLFRGADLLMNPAKHGCRDAERNPKTLRVAR